MDTKKIVQTDNVIDFHADVKELRQNKKSKKPSNLVKPEVIRGLAQPSRKVDFLNDQLGSAKNELAMFRQNYNGLVEQMVFIQKNFKKKLNVVLDEKRASEENLRKLSSAYRGKEKDLKHNEQKMEIMKAQVQRLHATYTDKIKNFKEQHKIRIAEKDIAIEKRARLMFAEKEKMQKNIDSLKYTTKQKNDLIFKLERGVKFLENKSAELKGTNEALYDFKKTNLKVLEAFKAEITELKKELKDSVKRYKKKEKEFEFVKYQFAASEEDSKTKQSKIDDFQKIIFSLKNEIESNRAQIHSYEGTVASLREAGADTAALSDKIRDFQVIDATLKAEINTLRGKVQAYRIESEEKKNKILLYEEKIIEVQDELGEARAAFQKAKVDFDSQLQKLEEKNTALVNREETLVLDIEKASASLNEKEVLIATQKEENADLKRELKAEIEIKKTLNGTIKSFEESEKTHTTQVMNLREEIADLKTAIDAKTSGIESLKQELIGAGDVHRDLEKQLESAGADKKIQNDGVLRLKEKIADLKTEMDNKHSVIEGLEKSLEEEKAAKFSFEKKMESLSLEKKNQADDVVRLKEEITDLKTEMGEKHSNIEALERNLEDEKNTKFSFEKKIESLGAEKNAQESDILRLKEKITDLKTDMDKRQSKIEGLEKDLEDEKSIKFSFEKQIVILESNKEAQTDEIIDLKEEISNLQAEISKKALELQSYEKDFEAERKAKGSLDDKMGVLETEKASQDNRIANLKEEISTLQKDVEQKTSKIKEYEEDLAKERQVKTSLDDKIEILEAEKESQINEILGLRDEISSLEANAEKKSEEIDDLSVRIDEFENMNEKLTNECAALEEHVEILGGELKVSAEQNHASIGSMNSFNEKIAVLSGEIFDVREEKEALEVQLRDLRTELDDERKKYRDLEDELSAKINLLAESETKEADFVESRQEWIDAEEAFELRITDFIKQIEERDQEILAKHASIEEHTDQLNDLNVELSEIKVKFSTSESENINLVKENDKLLSRNENLSFLKTQLEVEAEASEKKINALEERVEESERKALISKKEIEALEKKITNSTDSYDSQEKTLRDEIDFLQKQRQDFQLEKKDLELEIKTLKMSVEKAREDYDLKKKEMKGYEKKISKTSDQVVNVENEVKTLSKELEEKNHEYENLLKELEEERVKVASLEDVILQESEKVQKLENDKEEQKETVVEMSDLEQRLEQFAVKEENFAREIVERREELGLYSRWVDSQKESLKNHIVRFSQELQLSLTLNPLHSYLSMTKRELSKVELLLSKPGILGEQRNYLESHHQTLVEQKAYISELIEKTKKDIDQKVGDVVGLLKQGEFIPVPPLPPQK